MPYPAEGMTAPDPGLVPEPTRRQWGNAGLVVLVTQALRVTFAAALIGLFFVVFGVLTMRPDTVETWTTAAPNVLWAFTLFGNEVSERAKPLDCLLKESLDLAFNRDDLQTLQFFFVPPVSQCLAPGFEKFVNLRS